MYSDNPINDYNAHEAYQNRRLGKLPKCEICGEPIQQTKAVCYNDQWCCEDCEEEFFCYYIRDDFLITVEEE